MKIIAKVLAATSLLLLAAAPAAAQEVRATVYFGDLDIASYADAVTLNVRLLGAIDAVCERPSLRDLKGGAAFNACRDAAMSSALEQLAVTGARPHHRPTVTIGG
jgi:UrcA family protein